MYETIKHEKEAIILQQQLIPPSSNSIKFIFSLNETIRQNFEDQT